MAPVCSCCGSTEGVERHHLYLKSDGCPDDLTVPLCHKCHGRAHGMSRRINISIKTKAALAATKARGTKLGGFRDQSILNQREAIERAEALRPILTQRLSARAIAAQLNSLGVETPTGAPWSAKTVIRAQRRL